MPADPPPFYRSLGDRRFFATESCVGPWFADAQHLGPPTALLVRALERCAPRPALQLARVTVDLKEALSYPCPRVLRLLGMAELWSSQDRSRINVFERSAFRPKQTPGLSEQLGSAGVRELIARYRDGTTQQELADLHGSSVSSVRRLVRNEGAQRWHRRPTRITST